MQEGTIDLTKLSNHLFWDVDVRTLSPDTCKPFIVKRVLEYGLLNDWVQLNRYMTLAEIAKIAQNFRELDNKALAFIATLSGQPMNTFQCSITRQSTSPHWIF
jgi:hypothetical protein